MWNTRLTRWGCSGRSTHGSDDARNRLTSASGAKSATLTYDPLGRLYQVTSAGVTTRFVYDGDRLIAEYNTAGTVRRRYVHGAAVDEPLVWYEGSAVSAATRRYLHADHQGSIIATSNAAGTKLDLGSYDAYGVTTAPSTWRLQYTGQAAIPQLGLYYYKARFYNPALGRFMQTDPIGYDDDVNLYQYAYHDHVNNRDPTGKAVNFVIKFGADVLLEAAIQYATTGTINPAGILKEAAAGAIDPRKTLDRARQMGRVLRAPGNKADAAYEASRKAGNTGQKAGVDAHSAMKAEADRMTAGGAVTGEHSRLGGDTASYGAKGSTRADAHLGDVDAPGGVAVELKTGGSSVSRGSESAYKENYKADGLVEIKVTCLIKGSEKC